MRATESVSCIQIPSHLHATEKKAISIGLVMWGQVIIVKYTNPEHSRINTDAEKEDGKEASNLKNKQNQFKTNGLEHFVCPQALSFISS